MASRNVRCFLRLMSVTITCTSVVKGKKKQNNKIIAHLPRVTLKPGNVIEIDYSLG